MKISKFIILLIALISFTCCSQKKNNKITGSYSKIENKLDSLINRSTSEGFRGSVLVVKDNEILLNKSYGDKTFSNETAYWIGSMTKQFTAAAILRLQENYKLSVLDSIGKYLNNVPADKEGITIHHLLTHSSGLANNYIVDGIIDRDDAISMILNSSLEFGIGEKYSYSAEGYNLLAILIELVSEVSYEDYMLNNFIEPLNLGKTGSWGFEKRSEIAIAAWNKPELIKTFQPTIFKEGQSQLNYGYKGATGIFSTTENLFHWIKALRNNNILLSDSKDLMFSPQTAVRGDLTNGTFYGYGWYIEYKDGKLREIRHGGAEAGGLGHNGIIRMYDNNDVIIVLSNAGLYKGEGRLNGVEWGTVLSFGIRDLLENKD